MICLPLSWRRVAACGLALVFVALCAWRFGPDRVANLVADYRERQHWLQVLDQAQAQSDELQTASSRMVFRMTTKIRIGNDLVAGRIGVNEAAQQYENLPGMPRQFLPQLRETEQGTTDHERMCRHLIDYACDLPAAQGCSERVRRRLTAELEASLKHAPPPPATLRVQ
jgi:hypothetical protein